MHFHVQFHVYFCSSLLLELKYHELDSQKPYPDAELLYELDKYLGWTGIYNPFEKIYVDAKPMKNCAATLFILTLSHLAKLNYVKCVSTLTGKKPIEHVDGVSFVVGVLTLLRQFHSDIMLLFIEHAARYIASVADYNLK